MIQHAGDQWGTPQEIAEQLGVTRANVYDWHRDGLLCTEPPDPDVYRDDRGRLFVRLSSAAAVERDTRHRGRPRRAVA